MLRGLGEEDSSGPHVIRSSNLRSPTIVNTHIVTSLAGQILSAALEMNAHTHKIIDDDEHGEESPLTSFLSAILFLKPEAERLGIGKSTLHDLRRRAGANAPFVVYKKAQLRLRRTN